MRARGAGAAGAGVASSPRRPVAAVWRFRFRSNLYTREAFTAAAPSFLFHPLILQDHG